MAHAIREAEEAARIERVEVEAQMSDESRLSPRLEALAENARGESWVASEAAHLAAFAAAAREEGRAEDPTDTSAWLLRKNAELEADVAMWRSSYEAAMQSARDYEERAEIAERERDAARAALRPLRGIDPLRTEPDRTTYKIDVTAREIRAAHAAMRDIPRPKSRINPRQR